MAEFIHGLYIIKKTISFPAALLRNWKNNKLKKNNSKVRKKKGLLGARTINLGTIHTKSCDKE